MDGDAVADTAILFAAILTLVAIAAKLIAANLVTRVKRDYTRLDRDRKEILGRLKQAQLVTTSARGTLEFWHRRHEETVTKVQDATRDLEAYEEQFGPLGMEEEEEIEDVDTLDFDEVARAAAEVAASSGHTSVAPAAPTAPTADDERPDASADDVKSTSLDTSQPIQEADQVVSEASPEDGGEGESRPSTDTN